MEIPITPQEPEKKTIMPGSPEKIDKDLEEKAIKARKEILEGPPKAVDFLKRFEETSILKIPEEIKIQDKEKVPEKVEEKPGEKEEQIEEQIIESKKEEIKEKKEISEIEKLPKELYPYEARCSACGKITRVSFKPDGIRPVYCKECLKKVRERAKSKNISQNKDKIPKREIKREK
jgi:CxxC-x17-CxxC domain-containing protein